jgi:hypothetical protein
MMETTAEKAVAALLREAETAHSAYETDVLGGAFDEEWPAWYAAYLLDHGLRAQLPSAENLERGKQTGPWPDVYAQGLVAEFGPLR